MGLSDILSLGQSIIGSGRGVKSEYWNNPTAISITVDGRALKFPDDTKYTDIELNASMGAEASQFVVELLVPNAFTGGKWRCESMISQLKLGSSVAVNLGYKIGASESETQEVFKGFIARVSVNYDAEGKAVIKAIFADAKIWMMSNVQTAKYNDYSQATQKVLNAHAKRFSGKTVDIPCSKKSVGDIIQYGQTDYDFLVDIAKKTGSLFFISRGKVYFVSCSYKGKSISVDVADRVIIKISRVRNMLGVPFETKISSISKQDPSKIISAATKSSVTIGSGKSPSASIKNLSGCTNNEVYTGIGSMQELKDYAKADQFYRELNFNTVTIEMRGCVFVEVGSMITVKGFGEEFNNTYLVYALRYKYNKQSDKMITILTCKSTRI